MRIKEILRIVTSGDFPGGPVVKTLPSNVGFPCGSTGKESSCSVGDLGLIPGLGRFPGEGNSYPFWYSGLENSIDSIVHGVIKGWIPLSNFHFQTDA